MAPLESYTKAREAARYVRAKVTPTVDIIFCTQGMETKMGESVLVVGDCKELGGWDPEQATPMNTDAEHYPQWRSRKVRFCAEGISEVAIRYKYVLDCRGTGKGFVWEERLDREVRVPVSRHSETARTVWLVTDVGFGNYEPGELTQLARPRQEEEQSPKSEQNSAPELEQTSAPVQEQTSEPPAGPRAAVFEDKYMLLGSDPLAKGGFSSVWRCCSTAGDEGGVEKDEATKAESLVAKRIDKTKLTQRAKRLLFGNDVHPGEIQLHRDLCHPNVVDLREVFDDGQHVSMVMEHCAGGDLLEIITGHHSSCGAGLSETAAANVTRQLLAALAYVHKRRIVHRDVKCENIFMVQAPRDVNVDQATFKLGDFGLAARLQQEDEVLLEQVGSPSTSAPEVIHGRPYGQPSDLWSAGTVVYTALAAKRPFEASTYAQMVRNASQGQINLDGGVWDTVSEGGCDLVESLMQIDPAKRLTAEAALEHKWLEQQMRQLSRRWLPLVAPFGPFMSPPDKEGRLTLWGCPICPTSTGVQCCGVGHLLSVPGRLLGG